MSTSAPTADLLALLDRYAALRSPADSALKASAWNLTKARRGRSYQGGGETFASDDVREELRAQALLEWKVGGDGEEPSLVEEASSADEVAKGEDNSPGGSAFVLHLDGMRAALQRAETPNDTPATESTSNENEGLRRRRGNPKSADKADGTSKWTSETPVSDIEDEEEKLRNADPLSLFGVPPPALRAAQADARRALAYYVEAANLAREVVVRTAKEEGS
ncbi:hypothetical protein ACHAXT_005972 [Thalassiosira profunda]